MSIYTKNHSKVTSWHGNPCTVIKTELCYGMERTIAITYLNREKVWPIRQIAINYVNSQFTEKETS